MFWFKRSKRRLSFQQEGDALIREYAQVLERLWSWEQQLAAQVRDGQPLHAMEQIRQWRLIDRDYKSIEKRVGAGRRAVG